MKKTILFLWIGLAVLAGFFWIYFPTVSRYRDLKFEEEKISKQLSELDTRITDLAEERDLLKNDPQHLEKVIREELGLVKPGEIVYKFVPDEAKKPEETAETSTAGEILQEEASGLKESPALPLKGLMAEADIFDPEEELLSDTGPVYPRRESR